MDHSDQTAKTSAVIDDNLKRVYGEMLEQDVPDRFLALLDQLKAQESDGPSGSSSSESGT